METRGSTSCTQTQEWAHSRTGIDTHSGASIGTYFFIDHGTGVVIGETFVIGNYVKLDHGVTLGARSFAKDESGQMIKENKRHPNVQDHVTIYPNSTILGGETVIGEDSTIGANVFLMQSVPANSLVIYEEKQLKVYDKTERTGKRRSPLECASCRWKLKVGIISASSITVFARPSPTTRRPSAHHSQPALWSFQWQSRRKPQCV